MKIFKNLATVLIAAGFIATAMPAFAGTTPWMTSSQLRHYMSRTMGKTIYATKIECRADKNGKILVRFHTRNVASGKPFFKWQFVIAKPGQLQAVINRIPRPERPDLRYRVVSKSSNVSGQVCAVIYR